MDLALSDEQEAFRATARQWVDTMVVPHSRDWDRTEEMDYGIVKELGSMGFLGATVPAELGGTPVDYLSYCLLVEELGRGDTSVRGIVSVSLGLVTKTLV
jgi:alkylation response protein AidB-like acyl-CoA dehydrogenase